MRAVAVLLLLPALLGAQTTLGPSITVMGSGAPDITASGCTPNHFLALGAHAARPILGRVFTVQVVGRGYWLSPEFGCLEALGVRPPLPDGSYDYEQSMGLQARSYITTDVRIGVYTPQRFSTLTLGTGIAWRAGHNVPYVVAGLGLPAVDGVRHRFGFQIEYTSLLITNDFIRETWQGGTIISQQRLRTVHRWRPAWTFGIRWGLPL